VGHERVIAAWIWLKYNAHMYENIIMRSIILHNWYMLIKRKNSLMVPLPVHIPPGAAGSYSNLSTLLSIWGTVGMQVPGLPTSFTASPSWPKVGIQCVFAEWQLLNMTFAVQDSTQILFWFRLGFSSHTASSSLETWTSTCMATVEGGGNRVLVLPHLKTKRHAGAH
jgi:hypothetical protein